MNNKITVADGFRIGIGIFLAAIFISLTLGVLAFVATAMLMALR
jgi:hypothetical protein